MSKVCKVHGDQGNLFTTTFDGRLLCMRCIDEFHVKTFGTLTDEPELKPCPFCGGEGEMFGQLTKNCYWVGCKSCGTENRALDTWHLAIAAWNRRA